MANIWLILVFAIPIVLFIALRVNAVIIFLGLCLGYILSEFDGTNKEVTKLAGSTKFIEHLGGSSNVHLILLLLPPIILLLFSLKTASGSKYSLNLLPAIATGILAVIVVVPLLPVNTAVKVMNGSLWADVIKYQGTLIGLSILVVTIMLILEHSKISGLSKSKSHKSKT
ncbi:MAG: hypothetical protein ACYCPS_05005 [Candidatus Saccharimonadales bacterium]